MEQTHEKYTRITKELQRRFEKEGEFEFHEFNLARDLGEQQADVAMLLDKLRNQDLDGFKLVRDSEGPWFVWKAKRTIRTE